MTLNLKSDIFRISYGEVPERPKGADCKSVGYTFEGSNPSLPKSGPLKGGLFLRLQVIIYRLILDIQLQAGLERKRGEGSLKNVRILR